MRLQVVVFGLVVSSAVGFEPIRGRSLRRPNSRRFVQQQQQPARASGLDAARSEGSSLARWYDDCLRKHPLRTKMVSSGIVSAVGDAFGQLLMGGYDPRRSVVWALCGCFYFGPYLHFWYQRLASAEKYAKEKYNASKTTVVLSQFVVNQSVGAITVNFFFFFIYSFLNMIIVDHSFAPVFAFERGLHAVRTTLPRVMLINWLVWPIPSFLNLWFVPLRYRVLFTNSVALVWKCILSIITARSPSL